MGPHNNLAAEFEQAAQALRDFYLRSHRVLDRRMMADGASFARARLLLQIAESGPTRSTDLATAFGYAPRTVTEAVDALEREGFLRRDPDPNDRRAKRISVTDEGMAAARRAESARQRYVEDVFSALTAEEHATIIALVGKLNARLGDLGA